MATRGLIVPGAGAGRKQVPLMPGHSLMHWVQLNNRKGRSMSGLAPGQRPGPISAEELARHQTEDDCWMCIQGRVYNVGTRREMRGREGEGDREREIGRGRGRGRGIEELAMAIFFTSCGVLPVYVLCCPFPVLSPAPGTHSPRQHAPARASAPPAPNRVLRLDSSCCRCSPPQHM